MMDGRAKQFSSIEGLNAFLSTGVLENVAPPFGPAVQVS